MKKRVLSLFMVLVLCLTLLPTAAFAEGEDVSISGGVIGGGETGGETGGEGGGIYVAPGSPTEGGGGTYIPGEDTQTEIWCVSKPDSIGRGYDGTTDGGTIPIDLTFTDGTNEIKLKEGTGFTAKKTFDSADAGWHTVTVEIALIGEAAVKYKLKAGEETFTIGGNINKAYPDLTVTLSKTACTAGEKLLPLLSVEGAPEDAEVTYYYLASALKSWAGSSDVEGSEAMPKIDENTAISEPGTYYVYAKSGETKNYEEERSTTVELTVNEAVVGAASVTKADGMDGGTYESLPAALNAAQDGDTVKLLADHTTNWSDVEAGEYATLAVVKKTLTLDLNGMTVDYLTVGDVVSDEEGGILDSYDGNLTVVDNIQGGSCGKIKDLKFVKGSLAIQGGRIGDNDGSKLTCDGNSGTVTISGGMVCNATVGDGATVTVSGGTMHQGEWVNNGTLNIKGGTFGAVNFHNNSGTIAISGGTFSTLKNYDNTSSFPIAPISLLAPGHAFYKDNTVQDGSRRDFLQDVTVKEHTHTMVNNKCACGFSCTHTNTEGASTIGEDGKCTACGTQFAAGIGETYYTDVPSALDAATDGQTVKLLANTMLPSDTYVSKTLTLDLDGHSLSGYSLNVGGLTPTSQVRTGKLTVIDSSGGNGAVGVTVRDGGTLVFDPKNDHTPLLQLEVWGGTVELYGGKISRSGLRLNNGITLGDLLPQKAGLAYYRDDTQLTLEEATSQTCDLVVKSCSHGGKNGFGNNSTACPYCNAPAVAETALYNGEGNRLQRRFADLQTALDADRDGGATLKLLADVTGDYTIDGTQNTGLDLNGYSIKGTVTVKAAAGSTTTTLSNTKNTTTASIDNVVAHRGANLAGSGKPAVIGTLTLAEGATWKTILNDTALGYKMLNADGTHKWYARDDVKGSQLNNVIINRLPITTKILNLKVDGKNLTKVERGTTVQLCASCNAKDVTVTFSILKTGETTPITLSGNDVQYTTVGTGTTKFYVAEYAFNDVGSYTISFTATKDGYTVTSNHKKLTVTKPNLSNAEITFPYGNEAAFNYVTATGVPTFIVTYKGQTLKKDVDFTIAGGDSTYDVGSCTLTIKATDNGDYTGSKSAEWKVRPLKVEASVGDIIKTYDGTTDLPANTKITFKSADSYYTGTTLRLAKGKDYEVSNAHYDSADASETEKTVSFTIKLKNAGYVFEDGTTQKDFTLNGADFDDKTFQINKATIDQSNTQLYQTVFNDLAKTYEIDLNQVLDKILPEGGKYGDIQYGKPSVFMNSDYYPVGGATIGNGNLSLSINKAASSNQGDEIGTVTVQVETTNYQPFTLTIHVSLQDKLVLVLAEGNTVSASEITYGQTLADSKLTVNGTMKDPNTSATVDGTFTWTDGTIKPDAGSYDAEWTFTPAEGYEEYATATGTVTVKVAPKSIEGATITLKKREFTYNAAEQSPTITGVMLKGWSETITTYDIVSGDKAINANDSITLTIKGTGNYTGTATAEWKIIPAKLTVSVPSEVKKEYDGTTNATVTPTFNGLRGKDNLTAADYSVTAAFDNAKVGYKKTVIGKVTLNQTETAKNYVLTNDGNFSTDDGTITKAVAPTVQPVELTIYNGVQADYYVDLPSLPDMGKGKSYGTVGYRKTHTINLSEGYKAQSDLRADPENLNTLRLLLHMTQTGSLTGEIGTVTIPVTTSNYQDITLTVKISAKNRITPTGTPTLSKNAIIYGDALNTIALSGKLHDNVNNVDVDGTFEWVDGTHIPVVGNGTYAAEWIFEPTDTEKYLTVSGRSNITVEKARQYGKLSMAGYTYGKTPSTPTLTDQTGDLNAQVTYSYAAADSGSVQTWDISNPPALNAGTYRMYASIGDTDNYYGFEAVYCEFVVAKATPTYTVPTGLTAKYGQTLADVTLPDGWSWMDSSESVGGASTAAKTFQAKFTPKDTENYNTVENIELEVTVNKADGGNFKTVELEQKYTDASDHTYTPDWAGLPAGQDWTFSSEASIVLPKQDFAADGNLLTYAISGGKAGDKITLILKASCDNYENFTITLNVTLTEKDDQKPLTITGNTSVIYGEKLTLTTTGGSGMGAVTYRIDNAISTGEATIDPNTGVLTPVKVGSVSVIATKAGDNNYNDVTSAPFVLMIKPATPTGEPNYTIKATAGAGGSISPSGNVSVREGGDQTFTITPDKGYAVANVKIDGKSIGAVKSYTFENVSSPHTIEAIFVKGTASASTGDSSNLPLWSALLLASTLALAGAVHLKRKRAR